MKVAITGSNGYIGSHLVAALRSLDIDVLEISRVSGIDICNWEVLNSLETCDVIVHLAARTFVPDSFADPRSFYSFNYVATLHALELARKWNASFINLSSYVYGPPQYIPVNELHQLVPHNPYAQSKLLSEMLCEGYNRDFNVPVVSLRLFNLYGPNQSGSLLIPDILSKLKERSVVLKDPRPRRDYVFISDVVDAIVKSIYKENKKFIAINIGSGISYSVEEIVQLVLDNVSFPADVKFTNEFRTNEVLDSVADITVAKSYLDWQPKVTMFNGLKTIIQSLNL